MNCPRCLAGDTYVCGKGKEKGKLVWTMYYCNTCDFNWRDSEPEATINPGLRPRAFQLDPTLLEEFEEVIPAPKR